MFDYLTIQMKNHIKDRDTPVIMRRETSDYKYYTVNQLTCTNIL